MESNRPDKMMQLPVFATRASIVEDAPASGGGIADTPAQDLASLFQNVFSKTPLSKTPLGDRGGSREGDAPQKLVAQAPKTNNSGRAAVVLPAPALASGMRPATGLVVAIIESAAMITGSSAAEAPSPRLLSKAGFHVDPGASEEGSAEEDGAPNGWSAVDAIAPQPSAHADARPDGVASAFRVPDSIATPDAVAISDTTETAAHTSASLAPVPIESSARGMSAKADSARIGASEGRPTARLQASPLGHVEENARVGVNEQAPAMAREIPFAARGAWTAAAGTGSVGGRITDQAKPAPALPDALLRRGKDPDQKSATSGGERRSGPTPEGRGETRWGEPPPAMAQRAERGAPVIPAIEGARSPLGQWSAADSVDPATSTPAMPDAPLRRDEDPGQKSTTLGGERRSGPTPAGRGETRWGEPPPAMAQRAERGAPVVPAIGRDSALARTFAVGAERDAVSGRDQDADIADRFAADLPLSDTRGTVIHTQVSTTARPELARGVVVQLAEIISTARERSVELKLHPEELGRVSMTLLQDGGALTVALTAERGETLEIMRRHIDLLGDELRRLGYASVDFTFGDGQAGGGQSHTAASPRGAAVDAEGPVITPDAAIESAANPARAAVAIEADGMDIRL